MLVGVVCPLDDEFHSFADCQSTHNDPNQLSCNAPRFLLNEMSKNEEKRKDAKISTTVLTGCARAYILKLTRPYYIKLPSAWNMARGTWAHAMFENGQYNPDDYLIEQRLRRELDGIAITGQPDEVNRRHGILVDYKTKHTIPTEVPPEHQAQFNCYVWLLRSGEIITEGEHFGKIADVDIVRGGMHYVSWQPKTPWRRIAVPIWPLDETESWIHERLRPIIEWQRTGILPKCNRMFTYGKCDCEQLEAMHEDLWKSAGII